MARLSYLKFKFVFASLKYTDIKIDIRRREHGSKNYFELGRTGKVKIIAVTDSWYGRPTDSKTDSHSGTFESRISIDIDRVKVSVANRKKLVTETEICVTKNVTN